MTRGIRLARLMGALAIAAVVSGCVGSNWVLLISNESDRPLVARLVGVAGFPDTPPPSEVISLPAHSVVTASIYEWEGGQQPFEVLKVQILDTDCTVVATVQAGSYATDGRTFSTDINETIVIGSDLTVQDEGGGDAKAGASPAVTMQCPLLSPSPTL